jgi:hypothetical protein
MQVIRLPRKPNLNATSVPRCNPGPRTSVYLRQTATPCVVGDDTPLCKHISGMLTSDTGLYLRTAQKFLSFQRRVCGAKVGLRLAISRISMFCVQKTSEHGVWPSRKSTPACSLSQISSSNTCRRSSLTAQTTATPHNSQTSLPNTIPDFVS